MLQLVRDSNTGEETAGELGISAGAVEKHTTKIMERFVTDSIAKLTKYAIREGLTSIEGVLPKPQRRLRRDVSTSST